MKNFVFVSVAFGPAYVEQQKRLRESILAIYPDANLMFWTDELPPGSKSMEESLYGFKVHAIDEARKKYERVLWLDPAMILCDKVDVLFGHSIVAVKDDNLLGNYISDKCCNEIGFPKTIVLAEKPNLVGGSLYYFDFRDMIALVIYSRWMIMEGRDLFGSQKEAASEQINSHRNDESCMALSMYINGVLPLPGPEIGYCVENNPVFIKRHFK